MAERERAQAVAARAQGEPGGVRGAPRAGRERPQAVAARAQVEPERPVVERRGPGVVAVDEEVALGLYVRVGVLRVALAERDEQALVLGYRLEQRLHGLQAERQRVLDQVGIVVGAEDVGALGERVGDTPHRQLLERAAGQGRERGDERQARERERLDAGGHAGGLRRRRRGSANRSPALGSERVTLTW